MNATLSTDSEQDAQQPPVDARTRIDDTLLQSAAWLCRHYGAGRTNDALKEQRTKEEQKTQKHEHTKNKK